jgi:hypothetical protein
VVRVEIRSVPHVDPDVREEISYDKTFVRLPKPNHPDAKWTAADSPKCLFTKFTATNKIRAVFFVFRVSPNSTFVFGKQFLIIIHIQGLSLYEPWLSEFSLICCFISVYYEEHQYPVRG